VIEWITFAINFGQASRVAVLQTASGSLGLITGIKLAHFRANLCSREVLKILLRLLWIALLNSAGYIFNFTSLI